MSQTPGIQAELHAEKAEFLTVPDLTVCSEAVVAQGSQLAQFIRYLSVKEARGFPGYFQFQQFSIREFRVFWRNFLAWSGIVTAGSAATVCAGDSVEHAVFFPDVRLNFAENLLAGDDGRSAIIVCHAGRTTLLTRGELRERVQRTAGALAGLGVEAGDRVVAIAYSDADAVVACLASVALGASFSTAAPDMAAPAILSRFGQLSPAVLFSHVEQRPGAALSATLPAVVCGLPSLRAVIAMGEAAPVLPGGVAVHRLEALIARAEPLRTWQKFPFNHPLFILFSSGTTGAPKCIVHGAGGTLLEHLKELRLHCDLRPGERLFFQTSTAWMMWNWQLSALACRATIVLNDRPAGGPAALWSIVSEHDVDVFGTSPAYLRLCESAGYAPVNHHPMTRLRAVLSTGSILYDAQFDWVARDVKRVPVQSISGGTDIIGCFVLGNPDLPVRRGEAQCRSLALDVDAVGADSRSGGPDVTGELVCRNPFPSRPLGFFGDPDGTRFHEAYFSQNPGMWTHGDRVAFTAHGTARLHGRSDGVIKVRGIRIGTSELYTALQDVPELLDVMAVEQELPENPAGGRIVLLVVLRPDVPPTAELALRLRRQIARRTAASYVPGAIAAVADLPTTHSGKRSEVAARDAINRRPVRNLAALRNPACLDAIAAHPALRADAVRAVAPADGHTTEDRLKAIWAGAFGVDSIGADEDFFALGGDSLLAVLICTRIEEVFGYDLPIAALFRSRTIAELARVLEGGIFWQGDSPLVPLKRGVGRPLFLLHSVAGSVFEWHDLLARLDCVCPVLALQARGLDPKVPASVSVEEMAADYVALIRAHQPDGPYALMGYSFGGLLAYEIAVELSRTGRRVDFLGLVDTDVHANALPLAEWLHFRAGRLVHFLRRSVRLGPRWTLEQVRQRARRGAYADRELPLVLRRVRAAGMRAFAGYDPPGYPGEVTFFRSSERRPYFCDPLVIWRRRAASVRVIDLPGSHYTIIQEPHVVALAGEVSACLRGTGSVVSYEMELCPTPVGAV